MPLRIIEEWRRSDRCPGPLQGGFAEGDQVVLIATPNAEKTMYSTLPQRLAISVLMVTALLLASCGDGGLASFEITETSQEVTVEGSALGQLPIDNPFGEALKLDINLEQELQKRDASGASGVFLEGLDLEITDTAMPEGDTDNFNFLDSLEIYANADGLDKKLVAIIEEVPEDKQRISLETKDGINLKPYVEQGMKLQATARGSAPDDDTSLRAVATIRIEVF